MQLFHTIIFRVRRAILARQLGSLGEYSMIMSPDLITGGKNIYIDRRVQIWPHARIECVTHSSRSGTLRIGEATKIQMYFHCAAADSILIGRDVLIAGRVYITDHDHAWPRSKSELVVAPVDIGDNCWLGEGCAILKGVRLGKDCIVGTNAVVTRSAPAGSMLIGAPARIVKRLDPTSGQWRNVKEATNST